MIGKFDLLKAAIKTYTRKTKTGKTVTVAAHNDKRIKKVEPILAPNGKAKQPVPEHVKTAVKKNFKDVPIGHDFHDGHSYGIGATGHQVQYKVYKKITATKGELKEAPNQERYIGGIYSFSPQKNVFHVNRENKKAPVSKPKVERAVTTPVAPDSSIGKKKLTLKPKVVEPSKPTENEKPKAVSKAFIDEYKTKNIKENMTAFSSAISKQIFSGKFNNKNLDAAIIGSLSLMAASAKEKNGFIKEIYLDKVDRGYPFKGSIHVTTKPSGQKYSLTVVNPKFNSDGDFDFDGHVFGKSGEAQTGYKMNNAGLPTAAVKIDSTKFRQSKKTVGKSMVVISGDDSAKATKKKGSKGRFLSIQELEEMVGDKYKNK